MRIAYLAAGAAGMYCGSCLHDNTLAAALLSLGHEVALIPTYTPIRTDEADVSIDRVFFGAVNVYLQQKLPFFRRAHPLLERLLDRPALLHRVSRLAASTDARALGALTLSVLRGEEGRQRRELDKLIAWLERYEPEVVQLTNSMFLGCARELRRRLGVPIVCGLVGEELFLEGLSDDYRERVLAELRSRVGDADGFVANSRYYAEFMGGYLGLQPGTVHVVPLGIRLDDLGRAETERAAGSPFVIGYLARICPEKGLHHLVEAFRLVAGRLGPDRARLQVAGYLGREHRGYLEGLRRSLAGSSVAGSIEFLGELDREQKIRFLLGLDALSVPTTFREPKGLYVLEALASGVPVVQPRHGAFPEMIEGTGGGLLVEPGSPEALAEGLLRLVEDEEQRRELGRRGRRAVRERHSAVAMAEATLEVYQGLLGRDRRHG